MTLGRMAPDTAVEALGPVTLRSCASTSHQRSTASSPGPPIAASAKHRDAGQWSLANAASLWRWSIGAVRGLTDERSTLEGAQSEQLSAVEVAYERVPQRYESSALGGARWLQPSGKHVQYGDFLDVGEGDTCARVRDTASVPPAERAEPCGVL